MTEDEGTIPPALLAAYRATGYRAVLPFGSAIELRIDARHVRLEARLARLGHVDWAFVHAVNPRSETRPEAENRARHAALQAELAARAAAKRLEVHEGVSRADAGDWPAEQGFLVLGLGEAEARELGRRFEQYAVVCGRRGSAARLRACDDAPPTCPPRT